MAVNNTLSVKEYALTGGGTSTFPITFEFTTDDNSNAENIHCQLAEKNDVGEYTNSVELTAGVGGDFQVEGGNVKFLDGLPEYNGKFLVIYRSTPVTQLTDFIDNGNYSLEDIERALDKLTFIIQERTGTPVGTYINVGVSLFFASILQLTNKKEFLSALFGSWDDIDAADRPGLAASIRYIIDAVSKSGDETVGGHKTFTYSPQLNNDPQTNNDATRKSYVDSQIAAAKAGAEATAEGYTDGKFPVGTSQIADSAVTTAKLANSSVTYGKIANNCVTYDKLYKLQDTVTLTYDGDDHNYKGEWSNAGYKIPFAFSGGTVIREIQCNNGAMKYKMTSNTDKVTVSYVS